jgi:hypothetical protein
MITPHVSEERMRWVGIYTIMNIYAIYRFPTQSIKFDPSLATCAMDWDRTFLSTKFLALFGRNTDILETHGWLRWIYKMLQYCV